MCVFLKLAHHVLAEAVPGALAGERDERDVARLPGLEAPRGAGRDVEPHAARLFAVELERRVGLEEVVVRADLDRPVAGVRHRQRHGLAAGVDRDVAGFDEKLAGGHVVLPLRLSFRGAAKRRTRNPYLPPVVMDSGPGAARRPGMTVFRFI